MRELKLIRRYQDDNGTLGRLYIDNTYLHTLECPWRNNEKGVSCIPEGTYEVTRDNTGRFQFYKVLGVPDRTDIEIHPANYVIHPESGRRQLEGCIALGMKFSKAPVPAVWSSRDACESFLSRMDKNDFLLTINSDHVK